MSESIEKFGILFASSQHSPYYCTHQQYNRRVLKYKLLLLPDVFYALSLFLT